MSDRQQLKPEQSEVFGKTPPHSRSSLTSIEHKGHQKNSTDINMTYNCGSSLLWCSAVGPCWASVGWHLEKRKGPNPSLRPFAQRERGIWRRGVVGRFAEDVNLMEVCYFSIFGTHKWSRNFTGSRSHWLKAQINPRHIVSQRDD